MGKPIIFDWHPHPSRAITIARAVVVFAFLAIIPAGIGWGEAVAGAVYAAAFVLLMACLLFREITAIVRHTRFLLLDLWVIVAVCGSAAGGLMKLVLEYQRLEASDNPWESRWGLIGLVGASILILILRGFYSGLRLVMWLGSVRFAPRAGYLLLGMLGYVGSVAWKVAAAIDLLLLLILSGNPPHPGETRLAMAIFFGVILLGLALQFVHLRYRRRAQDNFDADRFALGNVGGLEPLGGTYRMSDLFEWLKRLAGMPSKSGSALKKK